MHNPSTILQDFPSTIIMKTTWKEIAPVPTTQEFLDIVLSRTQRRLPTQIRSGFKISRIRGPTRIFYLKYKADTSQLSTLARSNILKRPSQRYFWSISSPLVFVGVSGHVLGELALKTCLLTQSYLEAGTADSECCYRSSPPSSKAFPAYKTYIHSVSPNHTDNSHEELINKYLQIRIFSIHSTTQTISG